MEKMATKAARIVEDLGETRVSSDEDPEDK
jgi:hypothetical protein